MEELGSLFLGSSIEVGFEQLVRIEGVIEEFVSGLVMIVLFVDVLRI